MESKEIEISNNEIRYNLKDNDILNSRKYKPLILL